MNHQTLSVVPAPALTRLLKSRPTRPDINRAFAAELGHPDGATTQIPINDTINRMAARYEWVVAQAFPRLDEKTWLTLLAIETSRSEFGLDELDGFTGRALDSLGYDDDELFDNMLARLEESDLTDLVPALQQIRALKPPERLFVAEVIERFWGSHERPTSLRTIIASLAKLPPGAVYGEDGDTQWSALLSRWSFSESATPTSEIPDAIPGDRDFAYRAEHQDYVGVSATVLCRRDGQRVAFRVVDLPDIAVRTDTHLANTSVLSHEVAEAFAHQVLFHLPLQHA